MIESGTFFDGWHGVMRVAVIAVIGYAALILMLRFSRKRSLAQMNVFDFVYVVCLGEVLAITIMDERVSLAEGLVAIAVLISLQVLLSWLTTRSRTVEHLVNGEPTLLMRRGRFLHESMYAQRVTQSEILSAVREEGIADLRAVEAVVLETDGHFSVIRAVGHAEPSALRDVPGAQAEAEWASHLASPRGGRLAAASADAEGRSR